MGEGRRGPEKHLQKNPFNDTGWESRYVSYAYAKGVVNGINEYRFGGNRPISLNQYCSMVLRVLGYSETKGDFTYETAVSFASIVLGIDLTKERGFNRGTLAKKISSYVLNTRPKKIKLQHLVKPLVQRMFFTTQALNEARSLLEQDKKNINGATIFNICSGF
ncbi:S-layer homology domain-containing protein [Paenibacillus rhizoplanae]